MLASITARFCYLFALLIGPDPNPEVEVSLADRVAEALRNLQEKHQQQNKNKAESDKNPEEDVKEACLDSRVNSGPSSQKRHVGQQNTESSTEKAEDDGPVRKYSVGDLVELSGRSDAQSLREENLMFADR